MSGPEWTDDEPESRDDARSMSHPTGFDRAHAQPPEPAMDQDRDLESTDRDQPAPAAPAPSGTTPASKRPGFLATLLALASKIPLPSLGTERHEMIIDAPPQAQPRAEGSHPTGPEPEPEPESKSKRAAGRFPFPFPALKREARVGIAAVISFVVLVILPFFQ